MAISSLPVGIARKVKVAMVCESYPDERGAEILSDPSSIFVVNTIDAFNSAGIAVSGMEDIGQMGVYLTVAVKGPITFPLPVSTVEQSSLELEKEIEQFPCLRAILLMGDTAIRVMNALSLRTTRKRVIPSGPTYKIRIGEFWYGGVRVFPSYLQTGKSYLIERSKREMVSEDIANAINLAERMDPPAPLADGSERGPTQKPRSSMRRS
jgi:hypothetical protein